MDKTMKYQKGYLDMNFTFLLWLAGIGVIAIIIGIPFGLYWLFTHFAIVPV